MGRGFTFDPTADRKDHLLDAGRTSLLEQINADLFRSNTINGCLLYTSDAADE